MNLIVHIGTEKTGTTSIQQMLFENRDALKSKGFHFLQCAGPRNNRALSACCIHDSEKDIFLWNRGVYTPDERRAFRAELSVALHAELSSLGGGIHTVICSSEHLFSRLKSEEEIRRLYDLMAPHFSQIRILCWVREQCEKAVSSYSTALRSGTTRTFQEYLRTCRPDDLRYNYCEALGMWSAVFGRECMVVKVFCRDVFVDGDLICDFLSAVSPELSLFAVDRSIGRKNMSMSAFGQQLALRINRWLPRCRDAAHMEPNPNVQLRRRLVKIIERCFPGRGLVPSLADYQRIYNAFYESNKRVAGQYLGSDDRLFDFRPPPSRSFLYKLEGFSWASLIQFTRRCLRVLLSSKH